MYLGELLMFLGTPLLPGPIFGIPIGLTLTCSWHGAEVRGGLLIREL